MAEILSPATNQHLDIPLPGTVEKVGCVKVGSELALIVTVADENKLAVLLQFQDLSLGKSVSLELFPDQIVFWVSDGRQVDEQRKRITTLLGS